MTTTKIPICPTHDPWDRDPSCLNCQAEIEAQGTITRPITITLELNHLSEATLHILRAALELEDTAHNLPHLYPQIVDDITEEIERRYTR